VQLYKANGEAITGSSNGIGGEFTYEDRSLLTTITPTTINDLIQNPSTYYTKGDGTNLVPIASTGDLSNDWWNPTTKTIYDPCPNGYRIPKNGTYDGLVTTNFPWTGSGITAGRTWTSVSSFFPASGRRFQTSGKFYNVGSWSYSWMSKSYTDRPELGCDLYFNSGSVSPNNGNYRADGMTVRCIRD